MRRHSLLPFVAAACCLGLSAQAQKPYTVPITYYKLDNGLKVVLTKDTKAPLVTVAVYYNIGFRIEPRNRTGFAHLFEHMMFQGSGNLPKGEFDKLTHGKGGFNNGSTRFDYTNYFETVPSNMLEPMLWAEADRMKGLDLTPASLLNQQGVVSNEVLGNVINQPYGGFPWLDMPQIANKNWYNAHNFYGDLKDIEAATLADVKDFFRQYYAPNNAVLAVAGDFDEAQARAWIKKYFAAIPAPKPAAQPDISEPRQTEEIRVAKTDKLANRPALGIAYHAPERNTPEHLAMVLLDIVLGEGDDALLKIELVKKKAFTSGFQTGINPLGNEFNYKGPALWSVSLFHDTKTSADTILESYDSVIAGIQEKPLTQAQLDRTLVKFRSNWYQNLSNSIGLIDLLACYALFDDQPQKVNQIEASMRKVTPELMQQVAKEYLRKSNRTILTIAPEPKAGGAQ
jgi:zinc protease